MTIPSPEHARTDLPTGQVTFLFTAIEGSTRLSQDTGDRFGEVIDPEDVCLTDGLAAQIT